MLKRICALIAAALACLLCTGCLEGHSLERYGYVDAIGFDKGETLDYKITFVLQMVDVESNASKSAGFKLVSAECGSIFEAIDTVTSQLPYRLNFARTSLFLLSDELAMQDGAIEKIMNAMISKLQIRYNASVFISLGSAHDALSGFENKFDPNISKILSNYVSYSEQTGLTPVANISMLTSAMDAKTHDVILPLCGLMQQDTKGKGSDSIGSHPYAYIGGSLLVDSDMKTGVCGSALMSGGRMVGVLDGQHTQRVLMATGDFKEGRSHLELPDGQRIELHLKMSHAPHIDMRLGDAPSAEVSMLLVAEVEMPEYLSEYSSADLEAMIAAQVEAEMAAVFEAVRRLDADPFGFGREAVKSFSDTEKWQAYDWYNAYQKLDASFKARVELVQSTHKSVLE